MGKKYELIPSDKEGLFRVKALKHFSNVMAGEIGGYGRAWCLSYAALPSSVRAARTASSRALHLAHPVPSTLTPEAAFAVSACAIVSGVQLPPQQQDFVSSFFLLNSPIIDSS